MKLSEITLPSEKKVVRMKKKPSSSCFKPKHSNDNVVRPESKKINTKATAQKIRGVS